MLHLFSLVHHLVAFEFLSIFFQFYLHFVSHIWMIFLPEAFRPAQDLLCCLYHIMIGCQCKHVSYYLHLWYLLPCPILTWVWKFLLEKGMRRRGGGGLRQNEEFCLEIGGSYHFILRFFWRLLMMKRRKKICLSFLC